MFSEELDGLHEVKCSFMLLFLYYVRHIIVFLNLVFTASKADREILSLRSWWLMWGLMAAQDFFFIDSPSVKCCAVSLSVGTRDDLKAKMWLKYCVTYQTASIEDVSPHLLGAAYVCKTGYEAERLGRFWSVLNKDKVERFQSLKGVYGERTWDSSDLNAGGNWSHSSSNCAFQ